LKLKGQGIKYVTYGENTGERRKKKQINKCQKKMRGKRGSVALKRTSRILREGNEGKGNTGKVVTT